MNFVIDEQLPPALADWIAARGHTAEHVRDIGLRSADDGDVWDHCFSSGSIILTKDEDFAARRARIVSGPQVLWLRLGNATTVVLQAWLESRWSDAIAALKTGAVVVEIR